MWQAGDLKNATDAEFDYSLLGQRKYIHARINPNLNLIANHI